MNPEGCSVGGGGGDRVLSPSTQTTRRGSGSGSGPNRHPGTDKEAPDNKQQGAGFVPKPMKDTTTVTLHDLCYAH